MSKDDYHPVVQGVAPVIQETLKVRGVGRDMEDKTGRTICVYFNRELNDDELRDFHDFLRS